MIRTLPPADSHAAPLLTEVQVAQLFVVLAFCDTPAAQILVLSYLFALRLSEGIWVEPDWVAEFVRAADPTKATIAAMPVEKTKGTLSARTKHDQPLTKRSRKLWVQLLSHEYTDAHKVIAFFMLDEPEPDGKPPAHHGWYRPIEEGEWVHPHWQRVWAFEDSKFCIARVRASIKKFARDPAWSHLFAKYPDVPGIKFAANSFKVSRLTHADRMIKAPYCPELQSHSDIQGIISKHDDIRVLQSHYIRPRPATMPRNFFTPLEDTFMKVLCREIEAVQNDPLLGERAGNWPKIKAKRPDGKGNNSTKTAAKAEKASASPSRPRSRKLTMSPKQKSLIRRISNETETPVKSEPVKSEPAGP